ncbi:hypothetical protein D9756_006582 [Leucocoprinus leucothites]|uniref:Fungal-type protein kinase domain-containing protein n=1 Tax=Leucocoprinus leucothites TaxID=201217 RepID=A0A8H5LH59_9AGAR|nr:hypothetical protein D9756_006582 [Leucoagaricus leucothites]
MTGDTLSLDNSAHSPEEQSAPEENEVSQVMSQPFEAFVLSRAGLGSRLKEAGFVEVGGSQVDSLTYVRRNAQMIQGDGFEHLCYDSESDESSSWSDPDPKETWPPFVNRILMRMILDLPGVSIREFVDRAEFLEGFRCAIIEHEEYYKKRIIQRDINVNNIIISKGQGHLIDFDYSKITAQFKTLKREYPKQIGEKHRLAWLDYFEESAIRATEELYDLRPGEYLVEVCNKYNPSETPDLLLSLDDLGWPKEVPMTFLFFLGRIFNAEPTRAVGTPPFMSCRLGWDDEPHTAIHDVQSFLWVFTYLSLKLAGPGSTRREMSPELDQLFTTLFLDSYASRKTKRQILRSQEKLDMSLSHISPYFEDLKELIRDWHRMLEIAHRYPTGMEYNYPHQVFLRCID